MSEHNEHRLFVLHVEGKWLLEVRGDGQVVVYVRRADVTGTPYWDVMLTLDHWQASPFRTLIELAAENGLLEEVESTQGPF